MSNITFTPETLTKSFQTYRQQLITMPMLSMSKLLQHVSIRTGIRYREIVAEMSGKFQIGNYKKDKSNKNGVDIKARVFETFFGNCVESIDPNAIYQSIWGSNITKGEGLKNVPIVLQVCSYIMAQLGENLYRATFTAKRDPSNFEDTDKFFNGFKTIIDNDIAGTNETKEILISTEKNNLMTSAEAIDRNNAEDAIKDFYWDANSKLRDQKVKLFLSDKNYHNYCEAYQVNHGSLPYNKEYTQRTLDGAPDCELVPLGCVPDDFMLLTPKRNIYCLYNQKTDDERFLCEKSLDNHYDIDFIANMFFGVQFESVSPDILRAWKKTGA